MSTTAFYDEVRALRRERLLDAAAAIIVEDGWDSLTMTRVGERSGVPRQSLYKEVSSKTELGEAVVRREVDSFLAGIADEIKAHPSDLVSGLEAAARFSLVRGSESSLLQAIVRPDAHSELLSLLTSRPDEVLTQAVAGIRAMVDESCDHGVDDDTLDALLDCVVRLILSHLVQPTVDIDPATARITRVARGFLTEVDR